MLLNKMLRLWPRGSAVNDYSDKMTLALTLHFSTAINRNTGPSFIHSFTHFLSLLSPVAVSQEKAGGVQAKVRLHHRQVGRLSQGHTERQVFIS